MQGAFFSANGISYLIQIFSGTYPPSMNNLNQPVFTMEKKNYPGKGMGEGFMMQLLHELSTLFHQLVPKY